MSLHYSYKTDEQIRDRIRSFEVRAHKRRRAGKIKEAEDCMALARALKAVLQVRRAKKTKGTRSR